MSRDNSAQRMTTSPHEQALLLDGVAGRPAVAHNGWPNGQKTVDAETLSGNCWLSCSIVFTNALLLRQVPRAPCRRSASASVCSMMSSCLFRK